MLDDLLDADLAESASYITWLEGCVAMGVEDIVLLEIHSHAVHPGDWYLLCSDGLSDMLDDARIAAVLREQGSDVGKAAQALVDAANQAGGRDNIAVILVAVHAVPSSGQPWWPFRR